ncbi:Pre-mRNA splicing factor PRP21 like protein-domain-containing protein [Fomitopsis serialis]|uniref:Pre-mRNA splicing factor PRP21 like protein-domain-containing protein n=1 Tax=Fomitopsis serialis TaxID=139415 RepID=UPI00200846F9|nr:Pre-mRNA splicing factor PRP21 like protein-domain-containing protein [Neoantrodia serialis]KAH9934890.1 Pre-mRNA splicing factor PRP21 like protein-domain-containing protein [Neoantrodia serialis]
MSPPLLNGGGHPNGHGDFNGVSREPKFASGLILPPPEIKSSANPPQFEDKIRENQRQDPKFSFLNPADPYHAYYRHRMEKVIRGDLDDEPAPGKEEKKADSVAPEPEVDRGVEPPVPEFILDIPNITAIDLDIMKLTALFTARRGRAFLASLSAREGRNYQFDFLRPTHSLFGYFNRLVEQYSKVLLPSKEMLAQLKDRTQEGARWKELEIARKRARWEQVKRRRRRNARTTRRRNKIDWHDYAIVQTIEFTAADATSELPPPMSVQEVENMTLAQKRMAAMVMETTAEDVEAHRARQAAAEAEAAAAVSSAGVAQEDAAMEESDDEDQEAQDRRRREDDERAREVERARAIQANSLDAGAPMKIRTDYVPKVGKKSSERMTTCTICGQQIPVDELQEHMRIELLDPKWKSQRDALEARKAQASELQRGANVVSSLKNLARTRVDIFGAEADEEKRKKEEEEERLRRREREKVIWDGHTASKANTLDKYSTNVNFDEQIAAIHRAKGLGPSWGNWPWNWARRCPAPMTSLPPPHTSLPAPPNQGGAPGDPAYSAATISSGPQPASLYPPQPPPVMLPPLHYQGMDAAQPFGYQPPPSAPPMMHPARAALAGSPGAVGTPPQTGMVRTADQMEGGADQIPPAKRQKIAKIPGTTLYPEEDWINMHPHPISLVIQLPNESSKPEWKLDGQVVTVPDIPLNLLVSTLRDRILQYLGNPPVPLSRIRLSYAGRMLPNQNTIASHNIEDEDLIVLSLRDAKKR